MNSKCEWNGESIPRLIIEVQDKAVQLDHNGENLDIIKGKGKRCLKSSQEGIQLNCKRLKYDPVASSKRDPDGDSSLPMSHICKVPSETE